MFNFLSKIKLGRFSSVIPSSLQLPSTSYQAAVVFPISSRDHLSSPEQVLFGFLFVSSLLLSRMHLKCQLWIRNPRLVGSFCTSLLCHIGPADLDLLGFHIPSNSKIPVFARHDTRCHKMCLVHIHPARGQVYAACTLMLGAMPPADLLTNEASVGQIKRPGQPHPDPRACCNRAVA